jgi:hypothetical protein
LGEALALFLSLRLALSLFALLASFLFQLPPPCVWDDGPTLHATGLDFRLIGVWQRWDACWYLKIATLGYRPGDASVVFFPLYPRLMRLFGLVLNHDFILGGLAVSAVAYIIAIVGLYRLVEFDFDEEIARRSVLYISIFPVAFFFFAPFTESVFLALAVWTIYVARRRRWELVVVPAFCIGLTRTQGCLLSIPLAYEYFLQRRNRPGVKVDERHPPRIAMLTSLLPPAGFALFIVYSKLSTGWTAFQAQQQWGLEIHPPWTVVEASWAHIRANGDVIEALNLVLLLLSVVVLAVGLRRLPLSYTLYAAPQLLVVGSRLNFFSPLMATSRYVLVIFPIFVILALLGQGRRIHTAWLILSLLLFGFLLYAFLSGPFVA